MALAMSAIAPDRMYAARASISRSTATLGASAATSAARLAQARRGLRRPAARQRQPAAQLAAADPLDQVVGIGVGVDDLVRPVQEVTCGPGHPGVEHGDAARRSRRTRSRGVRREPTGQLP